MGPQKLEDQAATAALYATNGKGSKSNQKPSNYPLDKDGKLSSASAATSLKHAGAKDLPSFPVVGLANTDSASGAAASLANANQKTIEHWKPGEIPAANKAAMLAKDYKPAPLWQPELSKAGSKAALLAQKEGGNVAIWRPEGTDAGHSAAGQAMRNKGLSPQLDYGRTADGEKRAMMAATQSMANNRKRAGSSPVVTNPGYPDSANSAANALKAATRVGKSSDKVYPGHVSSTGSQINAGKIHNQAVTNLSREMYTANPPVAPEVEEKNRQAALRASAVSMAKQLYDVQQKAIEAASNDQSTADSRYAAAHSQNRPQSSASSVETRQGPQYANLQEAAQKLAAERLAKLHDEHAAYRNYYGTQATPQKKLSIRGRPRRRASSDGDLGGDDEERARQVRNQMSLFTDKLAQIDNKKRQKDRDSLLAVAQRNVRASMHAQDEKVYNETGKLSPAMMDEWESKARAKAQADSQNRLVNHGRVDIGGGKFLDQSEIDAIAAAKVQPTLDEITIVAEKQRARDEELRQQQLERERLAAERAADDRERANLTKAEWKRFKDEEKREKQAKKDEEKAKKAEEKRLRDAEKRKAKDEQITAKADVVAVKAEEPEEEADEVVVEEEPPVLAPIPHAPSIAVPAPKTPAAEDTVKPTYPLVSEEEPPSVDETEIQPSITQDNKLEPYYTAESAPITAEGNRAEEIARRVFAAPLSEDSQTGPPGTFPVDETEELAAATADTQIAPVTGAPSTTKPETTSTPAPAMPDKNDAPITTTVSGTPTTTKVEAPVSSRVALPAHATAPSPAVPNATTETTVSGPSKGGKEKEKDSGKVSSWLKTKFSRRTSKPVNPETTSASSAGESATAPSVPTTAPGVSGANSSDHGDTSMREVAMAGKPSTTTGAGALSAPDSSGTHTAAGVHSSTSSPEISSLSSDEDTRGRSTIRLADTLGLPTNDKRPDAAAPSVPVRASEEGDGQFEEARDTFDASLSPPRKIPGDEGRGSGSPMRDSKFVEEL